MSTPKASAAERKPEATSTVTAVHDDIDVIEPTTKSPYREPNFIGTYCAIALGDLGAYASFVGPVTSLALIDADIGPSPNIAWVALAWTLLSAIGFTLVGRLSDIFGRRWFFAGCNFIATLGCLLGCTAKDVNQLIGASVLLGFGAAGQISFNYVLSELVPVSHRFAATGIIFLLTLPFSGFGAYISRLFIAHTSVGWRGNYYVALAVNALATICWVVWYHPPDFKKLHKNRTKWQEIRDLDFGGIVLFTGGMLLFLLGLSWGGSAYPWKSAYVLGTLIPGLLALVAFVFYETFMPLNRPLIPMHLFKNYDYNVLTVLATVGGMIYYSMNVLFPTMVATLFSADVLKGGLMTCSLGAGVCCGQSLGAWVAIPGGHLRYKFMFITAGLCGFIGGMAGATQSQDTALALAACGGIMVGLLETLSSTAVTIILKDQTELGTGFGVFGSIRGAGGVIATAIYLSILTNRLTDNIKTGVVPAVVKAGLPVTSVPAFLAAMTAGDTAKLQAVPGIEPSILAIGAATFKEAYAGAFKVVFLSSIAFGGLAFMAACFSKDIDDLLTHDVVRRLDNKETKKNESVSNEYTV